MEPPKNQPEGCHDCNELGLHEFGGGKAGDEPVVLQECFCLDEQQRDEDNDASDEPESGE